ncbi:MAG: YidB family protein [Methylophilaceae bacterium]
MGLLDQVASQLGGGQSGGLIDGLMGMINSPEIGGLQGVVVKFQQGGLTTAVASWISTGDNVSVSAEQIQSVLGNEHIQQIADKLGVDTAQASASIAEMLPQLVDKLTPNGELPEGGGLLEQGMSMLKGKLFG